MSYTSATCPGCSPRLLEELAGDDLPLDFGRALVDARRAHLTVEVLEQVAVLEGPGPVDLDRGVDGSLRRLGGEELRHRRLLADRPDAGVVPGRRFADEQARGLDLRRHLRELVRDGLEVRKRLAERLALPSVRDRGIERRLRHSDREGTDARPKEVERVHRHGEPTADLAEHLDRKSTRLNSSHG